MCATLGRKPLTNAAARQVRPPNMNGMSEPVVQLVRTACGSFLLSDSCPDYRSSSEPLSVATKETALSGGGCIVRMAASAKASAFSVGTPVRQSVTARTQARRTPRAHRTPVCARYGDESQFFDLDDLENSAGSWDMYGTEDDRRYPGLQAEFFQRAAAPLRRREAILGFVGIGWAAGILAWGANGSKWAQLPIQNGPKKGAVIGPRGRI